MASEASAIGRPELPAEDRLTILAEQRRTTLGNRFWRRLRRERKAMLGLVFVGFLALVSVLGPVIAPMHPHDMAGGDDGKTLYLCAKSGLYRMRMNIDGVRP